MVFFTYLKGFCIFLWTIFLYSFPISNRIFTDFHWFLIAHYKLRIVFLPIQMAQYLYLMCHSLLIWIIIFYARIFKKYVVKFIYTLRNFNFALYLNDCHSNIMKKASFLIMFYQLIFHLIILSSFYLFCIKDWYRIQIYYCVFFRSLERFPKSIYSRINCFFRNWWLPLWKTKFLFKHLFLSSFCYSIYFGVLSSIPLICQYFYA